MGWNLQCSQSARIGSLCHHVQLPMCIYTYIKELVHIILERCQISSCAISGGKCRVRKAHVLFWSKNQQPQDSKRRYSWWKLMHSMKMLLCEEFSLICRGLRLFILPRSSTDWVEPAHNRECNCLTLSPDSYLNLNEKHSLKHTQNIVDQLSGPSQAPSQVNLTHQINITSVNTTL